MFKKRVIVNCERQVYLTRWFLFRTEPFAVFLHKFHRSDEDRALHDHPWSFITLILWRGYNEVTTKGTKRRWPGMIGWRPAEWQHRVELVNEKPAWTLVIRFRARREWGFWEDQGKTFVQWNHWWQRNCE